MSNVGGAHQDVDIDLGGLVRAIWKRRMRVLMATALCTGAAFAGANLLSPQYRAETRLLIESREPEFSGSNQVQMPADREFDESAIASQVQLLRSADLMKQVARNMKLHEIKEFDPSADPSLLSNILVTFGLAKNPLDLPPEERVLKAFDEKLQVYQVEKSRVVGVTFNSKDPRLAAAVPNEMAKVYLSLQSGAKLDSNSEASRWLEPEIANLREKVREAEAKVADYRSNSDLLLSSDNSNFATKQLNDLSTELARVRSDRASAEARAEGVRTTLASGRDADTLNDVVGSQMIQRLKENESTIQGQIADLSTTLLDGHPRLKGLKSQLQGIRAQIRSETQKILASLDNEAGVARLRERQLMQQLNTLKAASAKAGEDEVGLRALEREAAAQRQLLETYLARYREATSRVGSNATPADARVISQAVEPTEAYFPKVLPITIVAALASFLVSCVVIMLGELFSGRALRPVGGAQPEVRPRPVEASEPVVRKVVAPVVVPPVAVAAVPVAEETEDDSFDDFSIAAVVAHLLESDARVVVSVSPAGDQGSTDAVVLARLMAEEGRRVVFVDLTGSSCPSRLMVPSMSLPGITNLLAGEVAFADTIHADRLSEVHIVPAGDADPAVAMRGIERLPMIVEALSNAYDMVIVECGAAATAAVRRVARSVDASIVISVQGAGHGEVVSLIEELGEASYSDIVLMTSGEPGSPDRRAA
ncbi:MULTISPECIES: exopolysaccharide transport family protein [unclassified Rhizobium]|uniref:GumC family protein n=1 Tax=unclassified Rhizobium TaxID=2613769 RepID=UPI0006FE1EFD|nr:MULTISPECIES: exopolysaccharide transport family protein [unclassified Rhizobium]KQV43319.1 chain-length determining protein [Rhizobium sp. Root1212]KRD37504.1 chain-length determining protein [Rhizobium sp. Root268]